jgi:hypothetical protein
MLVNCAGADSETKALRMRGDPLVRTIGFDLDAGPWPELLGDRVTNSVGARQLRT